MKDANFMSFVWLAVSYFHARESPFPSIMFQALAKEIVMSRKAVNRLYENKAQLNSISMHLGESVGRIFYLACI